MSKLPPKISTAQILEHKTIVIMGIGSVFSHYRRVLNDLFGVTHITDNDPLAHFRLADQAFTWVPPSQLAQLQKPYVIVTTAYSHYPALHRQLESLQIPHCFVHAIEGIYHGIEHPLVHLASIGQHYVDNYGNQIDIDPTVQLPADLYVQFGRAADIDTPSHTARGNRLVIAKHSAITTINGQSVIHFSGDHSLVEIGAHNVINKIQLNMGSHSQFITGAHCTIQSARVTAQGGSIQIGHDCMFSHEIELWQTDTHPIFDLQSGVRLNKDKNIKIGNHVWLGLNATLLGGADIGQGSIVGAKSVTSSRFPQHVIIAGNPARVVREDAEWTRDELTLNPHMTQRADNHL